MTIRNSLNALKTSDIYSLMMFVLFQLQNTNEYSSLSQLSYILDKENLLKLCEFFGGTTITIPTIADLQKVLNALLLYQEVDIDHKDMTECVKKFDVSRAEKSAMLECYEVVKRCLKEYDFNAQREE